MGLLRELMHSILSQLHRLGLFRRVFTIQRQMFYGFVRHTSRLCINSAYAAAVFNQGKTQHVACHALICMLSRVTKLTRFSHMSAASEALVAVEPAVFSR